ncbi:MAG: sarcosine oxidase subunit gamma [Alphaproteobacteria bacterium]|nr:sarcosine oxidase subunit gamma [Alphaproteobacteria bacterium]
MTIAIAAQGVTVAEAPPARRLLVRGRVDDHLFIDEMRWAFGLGPPTTPCTATARGGTRCLWLDPTSWLVESDDRAADIALERIAAIEVTDARLVLAVAGPRARDLLAVGTGVDLHPAAFPAGRVVRTLFGRVGATLFLADPEPVFHLHVDRPLERWIGEWLREAARGLEL